MSWLKNGIVIALLTALHGCSVTPHTNYYVLASSTQAAAVNTNPLSLGVGPVLVADYLDRVQITLVKDSTLAVDEFNRWGEPLSAGITRVIMEELSAQLASGKLVRFPWRGDEIPELRIKMMVLELNRQNDLALMRMAWSLSATRSGDELYRGIDSFEQAVTDDSYNSLVAAYNEILHQLATHMTSAIKQYSAQQTSTAVASD